MLTPDDVNTLGAGNLPGQLGIVITQVSASEVRAEVLISVSLMAPNSDLPAGTIVTLADTAASYGCITNLPPGASGFTTIELKCNHLGTARDGTLESVARAVHIGRTTHVWDATVTHRETRNTHARFRCTQMVRYPKAGPWPCRKTEEGVGSARASASLV